MTFGLDTSAVRISGGTSGAMSLGWRVGGTVTIVAALTPGDGTRPPAGRRAIGDSPARACEPVAELFYPSPSRAAQGLDTAKKLLSSAGVLPCAEA